MLTFLGTLPASPMAGWLIDHFGGWNNPRGYVAGFAVGAAAALIAMILQYFTKDNALPTPLERAARQGNLSNTTLEK